MEKILQENKQKLKFFASTVLGEPKGGYDLLCHIKPQRQFWLIQSKE